MNQNNDDELRRLWQSNEPEKKMNQSISISEMRMQSSAFERKMRFRNVREYVAASIICVAFGWRAFHAHSWLEAAACIELVASAAWLTLTLVKNAPRDLSPHATLQEVLAHHKLNLDRQIKLLSRVPVWYLAPLGIGLAALLTADAMRRGLTHVILTTMIGSAALFVYVWILNKRAAAKLEKDRAALPRDDA